MAAPAAPAAPAGPGDAADARRLVPSSPPADAGGGDADACAAPFAPVPADEPLTWAARAFVVFVALAGVLTASLSPMPGRALVGYLAALAPALLCFAIIVYRLRDPAVSKSFLLGSVFITAVPGILAVTVVEVIVLFVGVIAVLGDNAGKLAQQYRDGMDALVSDTNGGELTPEQRRAIRAAADKLWTSIKAEIPMWKIVAIVLILAFAVAALTEETAKYLCARRYRRLSTDGIGCRGVIACASASALGLAAAEHVMYVGGYIVQMPLLAALLQGFGRAAVAFPLHVGTTFWVGTRMARLAVLKEPVSVAKSISVAVLFHGSLDAFAFFALAEDDSAPILSYLAMPFNIVLITALMGMCRRGYNQVVEREQQILAFEDEDKARSLSRPPDEASV